MKKIQSISFLFLSLLLLGCGGDDDYVPATNDTQSPSAPSNLLISNITETSMDLSWTASTDNVAVTGYNIYQDGTAVILDNVGTNVSISNLMTNTEYSFYVTAVDAAGNESNISNTATATTVAAPIEFTQMLSGMAMFQGNLGDLNPADGVQIYEINSTLFSDHAAKQRLIKLPAGGSMRYNNTNLLPEFPNNTLISKTFYYFIDDRDPSLGKRIIETRLLLKLEEGWQVTNYKWNASQTDAVRDDSGSELPISYIDINGDTQNVDYLIPSREDCRTCHDNSNQTVPIGMKLRNLNFVPSYTSQNQLDYFTDNGLLLGVDSGNISVLPNWQDDATYTLEQRTRAYMDVNCAHCHSPGGSVPPIFEIDFRYETPFADTGIYVNRGEIQARFESVQPFYRMPLLGRTVVHEEALTMLVEYLDSL